MDEIRETNVGQILSTRVVLSAPVFDCKVCGFRINKTRVDGKLVWLHTTDEQDQDHSPVLIRDEDCDYTRMVCDFCGTSDPEWRIGCDRFRNIVKDKSWNQFDFGSIDKYWAACKDCKKLVDVQDIQSLVNKSVNFAMSRSFNQKHFMEGKSDEHIREALSQEITRMFEMIVKHRLPELDTKLTHDTVV